MLAPTDVASPSTNLHKYTYNNRIYQWHIRSFLDSLVEMVQRTEPQAVLDAGCGEGFVTNYLAQRHAGLKLTGVDLSGEAISYAEAHFGTAATFRTGSLYKLPFSDNAFDTVVCSEVLEHLDEPDRALNELKRVARNYVVITVPREPYFKFLNDIGRFIGTTPDPEHVNFWTKTTFQTYINRHLAEAQFAWKHTYQLAVGRV